MRQSSTIFDTSRGRAGLSSDNSQFRRFVPFEFLAIRILRKRASDFLQSSATPSLSMTIANNLSEFISGTNTVKISTYFSIKTKTVLHP